MVSATKSLKPDTLPGSNCQERGTSVTIIERMRVELRAAMKARDPVKTGFLRYWIAQFTLGSGAELADTEAVKKLIGAILTVELADPPGFTVPGLKSEAVTEKSNTTKLKSTPQPAGEGILHSLSSPVPPYGATP